MTDTTIALLCFAATSIGASIGFVIAGIMGSAKGADTLDEVSYALDEYKRKPNLENRHLLELATSEYRRQEGGAA